MTQISMSDLLSQETLRDPIEFYGRLREQELLSHFTLGGVGFWIIATTYDEAIELLKDPRLVSDRRNVSAQDAPQPSHGGPLALFSQNMLGADPPDHTRLRNLESSALLARPQSTIGNVLDFFYS